MFAFERDAIATQLDTLSPTCRCLFAVSCAERLYPMYAVYHTHSGKGNPTLLRSALDELWMCLLRQEKCAEPTFVGEYESLIPNEDTAWTPFNPLAENAVAALAYAYQCAATGDTKPALWAAVQGYEAVDYVAHTLEEIEFEGSATETRILDNEHVQREISQQLRDIKDLEAEDIDVPKLAVTLRKRAVSEGRLIISEMSRLVSNP